MSMLKPFEKIILDMFSDYSPVYREVLASQIPNAQIVERRIFPNCYQTYFKITGNVIKLKTGQSCVPIEVILDAARPPERVTVHPRQIGLPSDYTKFVGIQLDFRGGLLDALEVYSPACEVIDAEEFPYENCAEFWYQSEPVGLIRPEESAET